jgi:Holliday junction resolvase-like predicted endonuclease
LSHSLINRQPRWLYGRTSMPTRRQILGSAGERLALEHYERLGFELLAANHRTRAGELDLIVADRRTIVFVEVKTRRAGGFGAGYAGLPPPGSPIIRTIRAAASCASTASPWCSTKTARWSPSSRSRASPDGPRPRPARFGQ